MLYEPTTLAATATALAETVKPYGVDPRELFLRAGLDIDELQRPGARYPFSGMLRLWKTARLETGDPCIGLFTARHLKPQALHALGLSWLASPSLYDGFRRMARYARIANTALDMQLIEDGARLKVVPAVGGDKLEPAPESIDLLFAFIVKMCRLITNSQFAPTLVTFRHDAREHTDQFTAIFRAPVLFSKPENALYFDAREIRRNAPAGNPELAAETDRIADRYLATLDPARVQDRVREILLTHLPSGEIDQETVARSLNCSVSSLRRQLRSEGATYRQVLDTTRRDLAEQLMSEQRYSLGQIAYLIGYSDQANFSRAYKRWTGSPPTEYFHR
jgi:AraC-like DNA-binding protein